MNNNLVLLAFGLTMIAGISTGIGGLIAFFSKRTNPRLISGILGFSAGVMIYVSFVDILPQAVQILSGYMGKKAGGWAATASFFGGILLIAVIDKLIPSPENPHEAKRVEEMEKGSCNIKGNGSLMKMGVLTAVAIGIHNFPEGIATFVSTLRDPNLGVAITVALAIHNIPEGIAVSVPIFCATGDRKKALLYSFLSGLSEPIGALLGYMFLLPIMSDLVFGIMFALVAGIMVFISLDELLPTAIEYDEPHIATYGLIAGMAVMGISILLFV